MCAARSSNAVGFRSLNQLCQDFQQRSKGLDSERDRGVDRDSDRNERSDRSGRAGRRGGGGAAVPAPCVAAAASAPTLSSGSVPSSAGFPAVVGSGPATAQNSHVGTLKKLFREKGFGFVAPDGGGSADVFLHFSDLASGGSEAMVAGMRVRYSGEADPRTGKVRARNVAIVTPDGQGLMTAAAVKQAVQKGVISKEDGKGRQEKGRRRGKHDREDGNDSATEGNSFISAPAQHAIGSVPTPPPPPAPPVPPPRAYERSEMLGVYDVMFDAGQLQPKPEFIKIGTLMLPACFNPAEEDMKPRRMLTENPCLDDEARIAEMETRLSRESGADRKNAETFGEDYSAEGWTFEEALKANSELSARWSSSQPHQTVLPHQPLPQQHHSLHQQQHRPPQQLQLTLMEQVGGAESSLMFDFEVEDEDEVVHPWERGSRFAAAARSTRDVAGGSHELPASPPRKRSSGAEEMELSTAACPESDFSGDLSSASDRFEGEGKHRVDSMDSSGLRGSHYNGVQLQ